jgi:peptidylprolyl isomerase
MVGMKRHTLVAITGVIILTVGVVGAAVWMSRQPVDTSDDSRASSSSSSHDSKQGATTLQQTDTQVGTGAEAVAGKKVTVHYTGTLTDGTKFDSSLDRGQPFSFTLGAGQVIKGWDQGVAGMKVGGKRQLTIPPDLGYGAQTVGTIPPNSTLKFDVELLGVE